MDTYICLDNMIRINKLIFTPLYLTRQCRYVPRPAILIGGPSGGTYPAYVDELQFIAGVFALEPDWMWETKPHKLLVF
jgi:hypothetical protein